MVHCSAARWTALAGLALVPGLLVSCSTSTVGPLHTLTFAGRPTVDGASVEVHPGVSADFTAFVVNPLTTPVTLVSASVVPVRATRPTGQLVHVGVSLTNNMV